MFVTLHFLTHKPQYFHAHESKNIEHSGRIQEKTQQKQNTQEEGQTMNRSRKKTGLELLTDALVKLKKQRELEKRQSSFNQYNSVEDRVKREYFDFFTEVADREKINDYMRVYKQNSDAKTLFAKLEKEFASQFKEFEKGDPLCDVRAAFARQRPPIELEFKEWAENKSQASSAARTRDFQIFEHAFQAAAQCQRIIIQNPGLSSAPTGASVILPISGAAVKAAEQLLVQQFSSSAINITDAELVKIDAKVASALSAMDVKIAELNESTKKSEEAASNASIAAEKAIDAIQKAQGAASAIGTGPPTAQVLGVVPVVPFDIKGLSLEAIKNQIEEVKDDIKQAQDEIKPLRKDAIAAQNKIDLTDEEILEEEERLEGERLASEDLLAQESGENRQFLSTATLAETALEQARTELKDAENDRDAAAVPFEASKLLLARIDKSQELKTIEDELVSVNSRLGDVAKELLVQGLDPSRQADLNREKAELEQKDRDLEARKTGIKQYQNTTQAVIDLQTTLFETESTFNDAQAEVARKLQLVQQKDSELTTARQKLDSSNAALKVIRKDIAKIKGEIKSYKAVSQTKRLEATLALTRAINKVALEEVFVTENTEKLLQLQKRAQEIIAEEEAKRLEAERIEAARIAAAEELARQEAARIAEEHRAKRRLEVKIAKELTFQNGPNCEASTLYQQFNDFLDNSNEQNFASKDIEAMNQFVTNCAEGKGKEKILNGFARTLENNRKNQAKLYVARLDELNALVEIQKGLFSNAIKGATTENRITGDYLKELKELTSIIALLQSFLTRVTFVKDEDKEFGELVLDIKSLVELLNDSKRNGKVILSRRPNDLLKLPQPRPDPWVKTDRDALKANLDIIIEEYKQAATPKEAQVAASKAAALAKLEPRIADIQAAHNEVRKLNLERAELLKKVQELDPSNSAVLAGGAFKYAPAKLTITAIVRDVNPEMWALIDPPVAPLPPPAPV